MPFGVIYDACVLHPAPLRDLLVRVAQTPLVRAQWTEDILDECFGSIRRERPDLNQAALSRTRQLMIGAVPDCLVTGYKTLIGCLTLPDPDDRHVLAAALRAGAQVIVTSNLRHFPPDLLAPFDVCAQGPDEFMLGLIDLNPDLVVEILEGQAADLQNPPRTVDELLETLAQQGLPRFTATLREIRATRSDLSNPARAAQLPGSAP